MPRSWLVFAGSCMVMVFLPTSRRARLARHLPWILPRIPWLRTLGKHKFCQHWTITLSNSTLYFSIHYCRVSFFHSGTSAVQRLRCLTKRKKMKGFETRSLKSKLTNVVCITNTPVPNILNFDFQSLESNRKMTFRRSVVFKY